MKNIFKYEPSLRFEICGRGSHFQNDGHLISRIPKIMHECFIREVIDMKPKKKYNDSAYTNCLVEQNLKEMLPIGNGGHSSKVINR